MALPGSGAISLSQVATELGRASTATTSLNESAVRGLAGIASGAISLASLWGKSAGPIKGYWGGGNAFDPNYNVSYMTNVISAVTFSSESYAAVAATLSIARTDPGGGGSTTKGYWAGGATSSPLTTEIDGINYSTQAAINPSAALATARWGVGSTSSSTTAYWAGGANGTGTGNVLSEIDGLTYSTEAAINPSAALAAARYAPSGSSSSTKGYYMGGQSQSPWFAGSFSREIDGITFSNNAATNPSATLSAAFDRPTRSTQTGTVAYLTENQVHYSDSAYAVDKFTFATEAVSSMTAGIMPYYRGKAVESSTKAYFGGGSMNASPFDFILQISSVGVFTFSTETTANAAFSMSQQIEPGEGVNGY